MGMVINFPQDYLARELAALVVNISYNPRNCELMIQNKGAILCIECAYFILLYTVFCILACIFRTGNTPYMCICVYCDISIVSSVLVQSAGQNLPVVQVCNPQGRPRYCA